MSLPRLSSGKLILPVFNTEYFSNIDLENIQYEELTEELIDSYLDKYGTNLNQLYSFIHHILVVTFIRRKYYLDLVCNRIVAKIDQIQFPEYNLFENFEEFNDYYKTNLVSLHYYPESVFVLYSKLYNRIRLKDFVKIYPCFLKVINSCPSKFCDHFINELRNGTSHGTLSLFNSIFEIDLISQSIISNILLDALMIVFLKVIYFQTFLFLYQLT